MKILAIDPGSTQSGFVVIDEQYKPLDFGKIDNDKILDLIHMVPDEITVVIEMVASLGMSVGQTIFDTCVWIGRFEQLSIELNLPVTKVFRKEVKMNLCGMMRARDSNIKQALVDRFSYERHAAKGGKGIKKDPGFFFGFAADVWQAYALGVTYLDNNK